MALARYHTPAAAQGANGWSGVNAALLISTACCARSIQRTFSHAKYVEDGDAGRGI